MLSPLLKGHPDFIPKQTLSIILDFRLRILVCQMIDRYDAVIVGGGHNGLTAAGYLAKAGLKTVVLERRPVVGGAVVTEEICPGYRISTVSYVVSLLRSEVIRDLELKRHGFEMIRMDGTLAVCGDDYLFLGGDEQLDRKEVARFSSSDYDAMTQFDAMVQKVGAVIRNQMLRFIAYQLGSRGVAGYPLFCSGRGRTLAPL
jgi:phytoene dehydrogenase-like protein